MNFRVFLYLIYAKALCDGSGFFEKTSFAKIIVILHTSHRANSSIDKRLTHP